VTASACAPPCSSAAPDCDPFATPSSSRCCDDHLNPAQYLAIRYTERLAEAGAVASVGSKGDSYDNAMAEAFNSLFKAELVRNRGPWKNIDELEIAVAEYIDWFNFRRLHGEIGLVPPVEFEIQHRSNTLPEQPAQRELEASIKPAT
jgi:putative transposase